MASFNGRPEAYARFKGSPTCHALVSLTTLFTACDFGFHDETKIEITASVPLGLDLCGVCEDECIQAQRANSWRWPVTQWSPYRAG